MLPRTTPSSSVDPFSDVSARSNAPAIALKSPVLLYDPAQVTTPPTTTDELIAQATALHGNGRYGIAYEASTAYYHAGWMHGFGASAYGSDGLAHLDSAEHVAALAFVQQLGAFLPVRPGFERVKELYESGQAPFVISGPWFVADLKRVARALARQGKL